MPLASTIEPYSRPQAPPKTHSPDPDRATARLFEAAVLIGVAMWGAAIYGVLRLLG